jgi:cytochrome c556
MKIKTAIKITTVVASLMAGVLFVSTVKADDANDELIDKVMKDYHKAPKGTDPVCKKAIEGKATAEELKKLVEGYEIMAKCKAPKGDEASWKEKTAKLVETSKALEKGEPGAAAKYKEAVSCKACHSVHKPD